MRTRMIVLAGCGVCAMVLAAFIGICLFDCYFKPNSQLSLITLDLTCDNTHSEIERAYRRKAKLYHPDVPDTANLTKFYDLENATTIVKQLLCFPRKINVAFLVGIVLCVSVALVILLVSDQTTTETSKKIPVPPLADEPAIPDQPPVTDDQPEAENLIVENEANPQLLNDPNGGDDEGQEAVAVGQHETAVTVGRVNTDENPSATATQPGSHPVRAFSPVPHVVGNENGNGVGSSVLRHVLTAVAHPTEMDLPPNGSRSNVVIPAIGKENVQPARSARKHVTFKDRVSLIDEADKENEQSSPEIGHPELKQKKMKGQQKTPRRSPVALRQQPPRAAKEGKVKSAALSQSGRRRN